MNTRNQAQEPILAKGDQANDWASRASNLPAIAHEASGKWAFIDRSRDSMSWFNRSQQVLQLLKLGRKGIHRSFRKLVIPLQFDDAKRFQRRFVVVSQRGK